ncbi:MAG: peptidoglycan DD-metalloendopeptidase family protein [Pseudomonadota bacterium]
MTAIKQMSQCISLAALLVCVSAGVRAQEEVTDEDLVSIQDAMESAKSRRAALEKEAKAVSAQIDALTEKMVALAREIQNQESALGRVELELDILEKELEEQRRALEIKRTDLSTTLAAMQKLSRQPSSLVFLRPVSAEETGRSAALLSSVVPVLKEQAALIRSDLVTLKVIKTRLEATQATYKVQLAALSDSRATLEVTQDERKQQRKTLSAQAQAEAERIATLAGEAKTLGGLLQKLREERARLDAAPRPLPKPASPPSHAFKKPQQLFSESRGEMPLPVRGKVIANYGKPFDGIKSQGLWVAARPKAQVIAPYDGQVVFADSFRSYGRLLIIEHSEGYHSVIAGLERSDVNVGQYVVSGEPIGVMGSRATKRTVPNNPLGLPMLYIELQRNGRSLDPSRWLTASLETSSR